MPIEIFYQNGDRKVPIANPEKYDPVALEKIGETIKGLSPVKASRYFNKCMTNPRTNAETIRNLQAFHELNPQLFASDQELAESGNTGIFKPRFRVGEKTGTSGFSDDGVIHAPIRRTFEERIKGLLHPKVFDNESEKHARSRTYDYVMESSKAGPSTKAAYDRYLDEHPDEFLSPDEWKEYRRKREEYRVASFFRQNSDGSRESLIKGLLHPKQFEGESREDALRRTYRFVMSNKSKASPETRAAYSEYRAKNPVLFGDDIRDQRSREYYTRLYGDMSKMSSKQVLDIVENPKVRSGEPPEVARANLLKFISRGAAFVKPEVCDSVQMYYAHNEEKFASNKEIAEYIQSRPKSAGKSRRNSKPVGEARSFEQIGAIIESIPSAIRRKAYVDSILGNEASNSVTKDNVRRYMAEHKDLFITDAQMRSFKARRSRPVTEKRTPNDIRLQMESLRTPEQRARYYNTALANEQTHPETRANLIEYRKAHPEEFRAGAGSPVPKTGRIVPSGAKPTVPVFVDRTEFAMMTPEQKDLINKMRFGTYEGNQRLANAAAKNGQRAFINNLRTNYPGFFYGYTKKQ